MKYKSYNQLKKDLFPNVWRKEQEDKKTPIEKVKENIK